MARRVTGSEGAQPAQPPGDTPKVSSALASNVGKTTTAAQNLWLTTGFAKLDGRVTEGRVPGDQINA